MATNNDDKNLSSRSRFGSRNDNTKSIKGNKETEYELMNIDVKKAERDIKQIFKTATDELSKFQKQQEAQTKKLVDNTQKSYQNMFNNITKNYEKSMSNLSAKNASNALGGGSSSSRSLGNSSPSNSRTDKLASQLKELTKEFKENSIGSLNKDRLASNRFSSALEDKINKTFETGLSKLTKGVKDESIRSNRVLKSEFTKLTDAQVKGMDKLNKIAPILESVADGINEVLKNWLDRFKTGMNNITSTYEATYTKVSVLTDTNQKNYQNWQNETVKVLQQQGLDNNVTISSIMEDLSRVTRDGITNMQEATEISLQNSISKSIAPYLDTTTEAYQDLQLKFGTKFVNQMDGIGKAVSDQVGSSRYIAKNMDSILSEIEPIAQNAINDQFAQQFGEAAAMIDAAVANGDMTLAQANELKSMTMEAMDPIKALQSDNLAVKEFAATASEEDFKDISTVTEKVGENLAKWGSLSRGQDPRARGALGQAIGVDTMSFTWNPLETDEWNKAVESGRSIGNVEEIGKELQENFKNDQYTTASQQKANYAENASTWLATFKEAYPDWYTFLGGIARGIETLVKLWVADKAVSGISKLLGGGGNSAGGGILKGVGSKIGSVASKGASAVGSGLSKLGGGLATGSTGTVASGLAVTGGALAGGAMAVKGGMDVYNDFKSGDVNAGTAMSGVGAVGGAVGAGALLALGASNPVGWVALAIGGIALAGREIYDLATQTGDISDELEKQTDSRVRNLEQQNKEEEKNLEVFKGQLEQEQDIDKQKKMLAEAGIASEEELQDEQYNNREALIELTKQYIESAKQLNEQETDAFKELEKIQNEQQNDISKKMFEILDKNYKDMTDEDKAAAGDFAREYYENLQEKASAGTLSEDEEWRYNKINEAISKGDIDLYDDNFTSKELDFVMHKGSNSTSNDIVRSMLADQDFVTSLTGNESVRNSLGTGIYGRMDTAQVAQLITEAANAENETEARNALDSMKELGATLDNIGENNKKTIQDVMTKWGFESFSKGTDYIPYDGYPALLHEGESVLTSGASEVLRSFGSGISKKSGLVSAISKMFNIATDPLKNIVGQESSSDVSESSSSKEIVDAIYYQTTVLEKAINNINTSSSQSAVAGAIKNATGMISLKTNYDSNMINLTPVMSS